MKFEFDTTTSKLGNIWLNPNEDWNEIFKEFCACMWHTGTLEGMVKHIAEQVAQYGAHWVEGVGPAREAHQYEDDEWVDYDGTQISVKFDCEINDIETEVTKA